MPQPPLPSPGSRRLLALDPGKARIGVAVSDDLGLFAHARPALLIRGRDAATAAAAVARREGADEVIVGLAFSLGGRDSQQTAAARRLVSELRRLLTVPVTEWDERYSSVEAGRTVHGAGRRKAGDVDSAAAAIVLQSVLDSRRGEPQP